MNLPIYKKTNFAYIDSSDKLFRVSFMNNGNFTPYGYFMTLNEAIVYRDSIIIQKKKNGIWNNEINSVNLEHHLDDDINVMLSPDYYLNFDFESVNFQGYKRDYNKFKKKQRYY